MPHRCVVGGCNNTKKDGVSLHGWPKAPYHRLWTNAVKITRADFAAPSSSSMICSAHFEQNCFEAKSLISSGFGLNYRPVLKKDAVPTIFTSASSISNTAKRKLDKMEGNSCSSSQEPKRQRSAFRKRETARVSIFH